MKTLTQKWIFFLISFLVIVQIITFNTPLDHISAKENLSFVEVIEEEKLILTPGVQQKKMHISSQRGEQRLSMLTIDLNQEELMITSSLPNRKYPGLQKITEQAKDVANPGQSVIGGINGDFFNASTGEVEGLFIHQGEQLHNISLPAFGITSEGKALIGQMEHTVTINQRSFELTGPNIPRGYNQIIVYSPEHGPNTGTSEFGTEVILEDVDGDVRKVGTVNAKVKEIIDGVGSAPLKEGTIVLSGHGNTRESLIDYFNPGDEVQISFGFDESWEDVVDAVSGNRRLIEAGEITDLSNENNFNNTVAPRTAVGIKADGSVIFLVIDGRNPNYSEGVDIHELAEIMLDLGTVDAINLDGGGSSTLAARQPGDQSISLVNRPSDGSERSVANGLFVVSNQEKGDLDSLFIKPQNELILANSQTTFEAFGLDPFNHPVDIGKPIHWALTNHVGTISDSGLFTAGNQKGLTTITAQHRLGLFLVKRQLK